MNKNENKNPVIEIRCLDPNTGDNQHDECALQLYWEEYDCGLLILPNEPSVHVVAHSETMQNVLLTYWSVTGMKEVTLTGEERTGDEVFWKLDIKNYSQRVFSMYRGRRAIVGIRFIPPLLDTMIERFGTKTAVYGKPDDRHYMVDTEVEISDQFYGWLLGFGKRAKLVRPAEEVEKFLAYVDKIRDAY